MKHILFTTLLGAALALSSTAAKATDVSAAVDVGTPIVNTNTQVRTQTGRADYYRRNIVTEEQQQYGENDIRTRTQYHTHMRLGAPQDIRPAAGASGNLNIPPSARVMGRIQGGSSYND